MTRVISMRYGEQGERSAGGGVSYYVLGSAEANGTVNLNDSLSKYQFIQINLYAGSNNINSMIFPMGYFKNPTHTIYAQMDTNNTYRRMQIAYASDTTITVSNRNGLNAEFVGIKMG